MNTYDIRLIAMDMDGTLLNSSQQISKGNLAALQAAQAKGVTLAICSGRLPGDAGLYAVENGLPDCAILALNGAYCQMKPHGEAFANHTMQDATLMRCVELLDADRALYACFAQNQLIAMNESEKLDALQWGSHATGEGAPAAYAGMEALNRTRAVGVNKIVYFEQDATRFASMKAKLTTVAGLDVTSSWSENLELMPAGVGKGASVLELAGKLGLNASQVMTIGDYDNDESMIACAGLGVAMGNATAVIKKAAKYITLTNDEDGVAAAVKRFVLK